MGAGAMTEMETLPRPNSAAGGARSREVLVDAHCHVWRTWPYEVPVPDPRTRGAVEQLVFEMDANDVGHAALVCASLPGNRNNLAYADRCSQRYPRRFSIFADLDCPWHASYHRPGAANRLRKTAERYKLAGVTHYLGPQNDGWLLSREADAVWAAAAGHGLIMSLSVGARWYADLGALAARYPSVPIFCHHLGNLRCEHGEPGPPGLQELLALANIPNVYIKVSGLYYVQQPVSEWGYNFPWPTALPVVRAIYGAFGPHRLVWGSDFPVARRHCTYRQALEVVRRYCTFFSSAEIRMVLGENMSALLDMAGHT